MHLAKSWSTPHFFLIVLLLRAVVAVYFPASISLMNFMSANEIFKCTGTHKGFHLGLAVMSIDFSVWNCSGLVCSQWQEKSAIKASNGISEPGLLQHPYNSWLDGVTLLLWVARNVCVGTPRGWRFLWVALLGIPGTSWRLPACSSFVHMVLIGAFRHLFSSGLFYFLSFQAVT